MSELACESRLFSFNIYMSKIKKERTTFDVSFFSMIDYQSNTRISSTNFRFTFDNFHQLHIGTPTEIPSP